MSSITLHPTLGVNPHLAFCPRCGGDSPELMLIGNRTAIRKCGGCGVKIYGHGSIEPCPKCQNRGPHEEIGRIKEGDKLPGGLCDSCESEIETHKAIVAAGGVYWRCQECNREGVIKAEAGFAAKVREAHKLPAPAPCGVEFTKCVEHGGGQ